MTLHFSLLMLIGLSMIPAGVIAGIALIYLFSMFGWELGALAGMYPGLVISAAGIAVFLVGLGQELG